MNGYLEKNLKTFHLRPALAEQIRQTPLTGAVSLSLKGKGSFSMRVNGVSLYDEDAPIENAAQDIVRLTGEPEQDIVVYFGFGFGLHAEFLKKRFNAPIIVFEPDLEVLKVALSARPFALDEVTIEHQFGYFVDLFDKALEPTDRRVIAGSIRRYREHYPEQFRRFEFAVRQTAYNVQIRQNTLRKGLDWSSHELENLAKMASLPQATDVSKWTKGLPGIFVGSGPSLSKNIHLLGEVKGRAFIVASNSALKPLLAAGVVPDLVMVIEAKDLLGHFDVDCLNKLTVSPAPMAYPEFFKINARHIMPVLTRPSPTFNWIKTAYPERKSVNSAGSVALVAFSYLVEIGCDPIVALGMDLAYPDERTHVDGADHSAIKCSFNPDTQCIEFEVEGDGRNVHGYDPSLTKEETAIKVTFTEAWGGHGQVKSYIVFDSYRVFLEGAAETWAKDRRLINATEGGARIVGFEEMTFANAIKQFPPATVNSMEWFDDVANSNKPVDLRVLNDVVSKERQLVNRVDKLALEAIALSRRVIEDITGSRLHNAQKILKRLDAVEMEMGKLSKSALVLNQICASAATKIRLARRDDESPDELEQTVNSLRRSIRLYEEIHRGCQQADRLYQRAIE